ncbi:MAG: cytochrome c biogenesis protein CcsA [Kofleriaceae bacterium]
MPDDRLLSVPPSPAFWAAVVLYAGAAIGLLSGFLRSRPRWTRVARLVVVAAFVCHGVDIGWRGVDSVHPAASVREALGFLAWIIAGGYLAASIRNRIDLAGAVLVPMVVVVLAAARLSPTGQPQDDLTLLGRIHISLATIGVALFGLASALAFIYLLEERNLKRKRFDTASWKAPVESLAGLDGMGQRLVAAGFPVFTVAMVLGMIWTTQRGSSMGRPEYLAAVITWVAYAGLLGGRLGLGWRGRRAAYVTLVGFAAALTVLAIYFVRRWVGG